MEVRVLTLNEETIPELLEMSLLWEKEDITYGYVHNEVSHMEGRTILGAYNNNKMVGYLFGKIEKPERRNSIIDENTAYFEIEEIYVLKHYRNQGIGRKLFETIEAMMKEEGIEYIFLSTATKDTSRILNFYINDVGMSTHSARLFKKIQ